MSAPALEVNCPVPVPDGLLAAFDAYETALLANDVEALDRLFAPGPDTVRGDGKVLLVGHDSIAGFRSGRKVIPTRRVARLLVRPAGTDAALVMASTVEPATGATGLQTQLWHHIAGEWKVTAAHVTLPAGGRPAAAPPVDPAVWRVVGTPLVAATSGGPLEGTTVAVKDLFEVAGQRLGAGNPVWLAEQEPRRTTAPAVAALLAAGAEITGIARTDEFAYSLAGQNAHYGTAPNVAVPGGIGGGSSSGPASAVAAGQVRVGLGTDTAGSIRVPASYQGLVGVRPTHGAVPSAGVLPLAPSFDTVGWLTRDVPAARRIADVLVTGTAAAATRMMVLPAVEAHAADDVRAACAGVRANLVAAGILPAAETGDLDSSTLETWFAAFRTVQAFEAWQAHGEWLSAHPGVLGPDVGGRFASAATVSAAEADEARGVVSEARTRLRALLDGAVLVLPTTRGGAPDRNAGADIVEAERAGTLRLTCLAGLGGLPAVSLPLARTADGRPAGLCLVGAAGTDLALLDLAATIEGSVR
ncbi:DUF3225 domain-containing protein [Amycolatopsis acidicola]|uniref:DUF3225 domain-containing protein n=1 Tax=Amycolatopsis acidicola TaxID=2596893 RepID=A0A5N0VIB0_9PSEU|nr:AtzH-like domain-containing protein [Amycolatopsis acidicola]KAA9166117.1 DUF3225 domain-containing protein [Amycolatopsis acidicola]